MKWKSNRIKRQKRAGDGGNPAEMLFGKWPTEGEVKEKFEYPSCRPALTARDVLAFQDENRSVKYESGPL
jgi:hypothetical protein